MGNYTLWNFVFIIKVSCSDNFIYTSLQREHTGKIKKSSYDSNLESTCSFQVRSGALYMKAISVGNKKILSDFPSSHHLLYSTKTDSVYPTMRLLQNLKMSPSDCAAIYRRGGIF